MLLSGWTSTHVAELFGLTRWSVFKWIRKVNMKGLEGIEDGVRTGRPSQFDNALVPSHIKSLTANMHNIGSLFSVADGKKQRNCGIRVRQLDTVFRYDSPAANNLFWETHRQLP